MLPWIKIIAASVLSALLGFFGYLFVSHQKPTFVTTVLFTVVCYTIARASLALVAKALSWNPPLQRRRVFRLKVLFLVLLSLEGILRLLGVNQSYNERLGFFHASGFRAPPGRTGKNNLWIHNPRASYTDKRPEFSFTVTTNSEGLRDREFSLNKGEHEYRILCIGNSFTEGVGAAEGATWPRQLEKLLSKDSSRTYSVMNAGISGSDPFFEYMLLKGRLLLYGPNLVILTLVASSDIDSHRFRGGFERFSEHGVRFRKGPWWERWYALSYIVRFVTDDILRYKYFLRPREAQAEYQTALSDLYDCVKKFETLLDAHGIPCLVILIETGNLGLAPLRERLESETDIPLLSIDEYFTKIERLEVRDTIRLQWPIDGHFNARGYALFAKGVEWKLKQMGLIEHDAQRGPHSDHPQNQ